MEEKKTEKEILTTMIDKLAQTSTLLGMYIIEVDRNITTENYFYWNKKLKRLMNRKRALQHGIEKLTNKFMS